MLDFFEPAVIGIFILHHTPNICPDYSQDTKIEIICR